MASNSGGGGGSGKKDKKDKKPDKDKDKADVKKADTSAYWAMKVREFFSPRKRYLDLADQTAVEEEPEFLQRIQKTLDEESALFEAKRAKIIAERRKRAAERFAVDGDVEARIDADANALMRRRFGGKDKAAEDEEELGPPPTRDEVMAYDMRKAQAALQSPWVQASWGVTALRMQRLVYTLVMLPITAITALRAAWAGLFTTKRYENFLMAEGERIWYWRNRTENERWFWEIFAWDRLVFPVICSFAYQCLVPANFVWSVIVPVTFVFWETGQVPGLWDFDFWLIAYFGFWRKCWPQTLALLLQLTQWS